MSKWQRIETAPRDGTEVDLWVVGATGKGSRVPDCHWHCGEWLVWGGDPEIGWLRPTGEEDRATHWQPLPEPPVEAEDKLAMGGSR